MLSPDRPRFNRPSTTPQKTVGSLSPAQLLAVRQFVARVGGLENARRSLEMLALLGRAS
jgi:hypothetical protein